jgi:HKD family nuclease
MSTKLIRQPTDAFRLGDFLLTSLKDESWNEFRAAIAFVKQSGTKHIKEAVDDFSRRGRVRLSVGIDVGGTSAEGFSDLLEALDARGDIWIFHNAGNPTFHPKVYLFKNDQSADLVVGSGNLTEGGLYTNYEASMRMRLDLRREEHVAILREAEEMLDFFCLEQEGLCYKLDGKLLERLVADGEVPTEAQSREVEEGRGKKTEAAAAKTSIFKRVAVPAAPARPREAPDLPEEAYAEEEVVVEVPPPAAAQAGNYKVFLMTLQRTDVGVGQTTAGTSRRSPEIFIPLAGRDADTDFWGWPGQFVEDASRPGKMDRFGVKMRIGTTIIDVNMMTWPVKHDFRLRSESLRSAGSVGDILRIERADGKGGFTYYVEVIPQGTTQYDDYLPLCVNPVRNSAKRWGYC